MFTNRSAPGPTVVPVLLYPDAAEASDWLCRVFGFTERLRAGRDHVQLVIDLGAGTGAAMLSGRTGLAPAETPLHYVFVAVADVDAHYARTLTLGAQVGGPPTAYPFGERQYTATDLFGHRWTFSQSVTDVAPADWGATAPA